MKTIWQLLVVLALSLVSVVGEASVATLTWQANTETDLAGYNIRKCTVVPPAVTCTPVNGLTQLPANAVRFDDTAVSPGSTYGWALNAFDTTTNQSAFTPTIYGTIPSPPAGVIGIDVASNSVTTNAASSVTWSHSVAVATNRFLGVCTYSRGTVQANQVVTAVTYDGVGLTHLRTDERFSGTEYFHTELWYMTAPNTGTHNVVTTWAGAPGSYGVGNALSLSGVNQGAPIDAQAGNNGANPTLSASVTTVTAHALLFDCAVGQTEPITVGAGQVAYKNATIGTSPTDGSGLSVMADKIVAGAEVMDWTQADAGNFAISAVAIAPVAGSASGIVYDTASTSTSSSANSKSWSHAIGTLNNRIFAVCAHSRGTVQANNVVSSITIGGQALTKIRHDEILSTEYFRSEIWYRLAPPTGTNTVTVTWVGAPSVYSVGQGVSFGEVDQAAPIDAQAGSTGTGTALATSITTVAANAWIFDCPLAQAPITAVGAGQTQRVILVSTDDHAISTVNGKAAPGAETMDWTQTAAQAWVVNTASLKPAAPAIEPGIIGMTVDETGITFTYNATTPTNVRVATDFNNVTVPIGSIPGGRYTFVAPIAPLSPLVTFICGSAINVLGVENTDSNLRQCRQRPTPVAQDTNPPVLTNGLPVATQPVNTSTVTLSFNVDKQPVTCLYHTADVPYNQMPTNNVMTVSNLLASAAVSGFANGSSTPMYGACNFVDTVGASHPSSNILITVVIAAAPAGDTTRPSDIPASPGLTGQQLQQAQLTLAWPAASDNTAVTDYQVFQCNLAACAPSTLIGNPVGLTQFVTTLSPNTLYRYCVKARDAAQNVSLNCSNVFEITTSNLFDITPPSSVPIIRSSAIGATNITVTFGTGSDNLGITGVQLEGCFFIGCSDFQTIASSLSPFDANVLSLPAMTSVTLRAKFLDAAHNLSSDYGPTLITGTTAASPNRAGSCRCYFH